MSHYDDKFFLAIQLQDHEIIERLIDKVDVNSRNGNALSVSANQGDYETVKMLLQAGANADADKSKALILAAQQGDTEMVKLLVAYGAKNIDGAIRAAAKKEKKQSIMELLRHTNARNEFRRISENILLMIIINEIFESMEKDYKKALMRLMAENEISLIEELTKSDILEKLRVLEPKIEKKNNLVLKMKW